MNFFLPGMGATSKMYDGAWLEAENFNFLDWPDYEGETELAEVALKLIEEHNISSCDRVWGTSLGGMIACEIARILQMKQVGLLGSAKHPNEVRSLLRYFSSLAKITPIHFVQKLAGKYDAKLLKMFKESDPDFIRSMCLAVFNWEGLNSSDIEVIRFHGRKDHVIPLPKKVDHIIEGGHLIVMTHAEELVQLIEKSDHK